MRPGLGENRRPSPGRRKKRGGHDARTWPEDPELVTLFNLEVLNRGSDYDTALLTITDVNRPGLQFHSFYDYFDPRRLQVLGKAEITYLKGLTTEQRRRTAVCWP